MSYRVYYSIMGVVLSVIVSFSAHAQVLTKAEPYFNSKEMSDMRRCQTDKIPEFLNCTNVKFKVAAVPNLIPFVPTSEKNIVQYERFFKY